MNKRFFLTLGIASAVHIVADRRKTVAVLYERMRLLGVWEDE